MWKIKFNHVQDLSDARFAASTLAEWVGFSISGTHAMRADAIQEIIAWCAGPKLILEISDENTEKINSFLDVLPVDGIECSESRMSELKAAFPDVREWIILGDGPYENTSHSHNWHTHEHLVNVIPTLETAKKIASEKPYGFSINCEKETEVGKKDFGELHDFCEELDLF